MYLIGSTSWIIILPEPTPGKRREQSGINEVGGMEEVLSSFLFSWQIPFFVPASWSQRVTTRVLRRIRLSPLRTNIEKSIYIM
ncbi:MAG TPA: hypothetical protein PK154_00845 [Methanoregulaceae archaeon]|jgi:hypothetical protein|nr:hypothetical protein [Methanoregulaceae archaeon]HPW09641.1 hypothetical protein [Methanoregulaceae archaeon]